MHAVWAGCSSHCLVCVASYTRNATSGSGTGHKTHSARALTEAPGSGTAGTDERPTPALALASPRLTVDMFAAISARALRSKVEVNDASRSTKYYFTTR